MPLTITDILPEVRVELGDLTGDIFTDDEITNYFVPAAVTKLGSVWPQVYSLDDITFVPDPTANARNDKRAIVIYVALEAASFSTALAAQGAAYHSDVAGATDLRDSALEQVKWRTRLLDEIQELLRQRVQRQVEADVSLTEPSRSETTYGT